MGLKYFCEYRTLNTNELWKVEIYLPDYSGEPIRKIGAAGQTCIIDWSGGDKLLDKFAIGSSASITLLFDDAAEVTELQNINDKTVVVKVYNNGGTDLYWQGYLISDGVQHPDSGVIFPITLTAVDMIEASNEITFANTDVGAVTIGSVVGSEKSPLNWIRKCLAFTSNMSNDMPIRWSCSITNLQYPTDDFFGGRTSWVYNYDEFLASRQDTFVGWMLENIVKSVGCVLFQNGGYWYIVSLKDLAVSNTLTFNQITAGLGAKTATTTSINLSKVLPNKLNESTYTMVQKPISKVKATYNHSMQTNIIPNGGFDIVESGKPLYWDGSQSYIELNSTSSINSRGAGSAVRAKNNSLLAIGELTYGIGDLHGLPLDANILFKNIQWGFTFMPTFAFPTNEDGTIDWTDNPLNARVLYTSYDSEGNLTEYSLNEFGFWQSASPTDAFKVVSVTRNLGQTIVKFSGTSYNGQILRRTYFIDPVPNIIEFKSTRTLLETLNYIALNDSIASVSGTDTIIYSHPTVNVSITQVNPFSATLIPFKVEGMKLQDVATIQFQSKGNQGNILMPNPGVLTSGDAVSGAAELRVELVLKQGQEVVFDDLYMNVSGDKEYWDITDNGTDGKAEYELDISSSFSGFMTSSYMDNFATSDLSMTISNGLDNGTLTEIFGKMALRMLSNPTKKIDADLEGTISLLNLLQYSGGKYLPLKSSVNTETNESKVTIFELNYDDGLLFDSTHKSTGDGESSGIGGTGTGGGTGGGGGTQTLQQTLNYGRVGDKMEITQSMQIPTVAPEIINAGNIWIGAGTSASEPDATALATLSDVALSSLANNQVLTYNSTTGKWENKTASGGGGGTWGSITGTLSAQTDLNSALLSKQPGLVSGSNIKTINGNSILGPGNLVISGGVTSVGVSVPTGLTVSGSPVTTSGTIAIGLQPGYAITTITRQGQWDIGYNHSQVLNSNPHNTNLQQILNVANTGTAMKITASMEIPTVAPSSIQAGNIWVGTGTSASSLTKTKVNSLTDLTSTTISIGSAQATTYLVATNASVIAATITSGTALTSIFVRQGGAGKVTFTGSGVTVLVKTGKVARTEGQNAVVEIFYETTTRVIITGDLDI